MLRDRILADVVVAVHAAFVGFVVLGMLVIVVGLLRRWPIARWLWFRVTHLVAILIVALLSLAGIVCPLTTWEKELRARAGEASYLGDFVAHWLHELIFFEAPTWVFTLSYVLFGLAVVVLFWLAPPRRALTSRTNAA